MRRPFAVFDPATGDKIGEAPDFGRPEVREAIDRAAEAFASWAGRSAFERAALLRAWHQRILAAQEDLAYRITREAGKPLAESRAEVAYGADFVLWCSQEAVRVGGETIPAAAPDKRLLVLRQPAGVVGAITPWNFPVAMVTRKVAPALAAGCSVVLKPAEQTPLSALDLAALAREAGIPPGVLEVVPAARPEEVSAEFFEHPAVRVIAFTGSTEVGRVLLRGAADQIKRVVLELGGNAPLIVFEDADLEDAASKAVVCKFRNAGQTCICANRIFVHRAVYGAFAEIFIDRVRRLRVGPGLEEGVEVGPLIDAAQLAKVERHVRDAVERGARIACGGHRIDRPGTFFEPTVLADVTDDMLVVREETFGPVAPLLSFASEDEAVRRANGTPCGLAAYFFTRDLRRAVRVAEALEFGMVGINDVRISAAHVPFGGFKQSGIGREGGRWALEEFLEIKYVSVEV